MAITQCVECDEDIEVDNRVRLGQHLVCEHCGTELEIVSVDPLEVEVAQIDSENRLWEEGEAPAYGDLDDEMLDKGLDPLDDEIDDLDDEEDLDDEDFDDDELDGAEADDELMEDMDDELDEFDYDYDDEEEDFDFDDDDFVFDDEDNDRW